MTYKLTKKTTKNIGYPDGKKGGNNPKKIVIHHWGGDGQNFDAVVNWLCNPNAGVSAHYVVEAGKVCKLAEDTDCCWHAGSAVENQRSIGIECRPECSKADRQTLIELIADLYKKHGVLPVVGHKDVANTACPGRYYKYLKDMEKEAAELAKKKPTTSKTGYSKTFPKLPSKGYFEQGDFGTQVKYLQRFLNWCIGSKLDADGIYGLKTKNAVKVFQKKYNLTVDGKFGTKCLAKAKTIKK